MRRSCQKLEDAEEQTRIAHLGPNKARNDDKTLMK